MIFATIREFRDNATRMFRSREAILVTKRGHVAGFYFPNPGKTLPLELKRECLKRLVGTLKWKGPSPAEEAGILKGFLASRKNRR